MADDNDSSDLSSKDPRFKLFQKWWRMADVARADDTAADHRETVERLKGLKAKVVLIKYTAAQPEVEPKVAPGHSVLWSNPQRDLTLNELIRYVTAESGHEEVYVIFRKRDVSRLDDDRLPDMIDIADDIEDACKALLRVAGIDDVEAETLGLDKFTGGNIMDLCHRLGEITGDVYEVAPHERPKSRKPV